MTVVHLSRPLLKDGFDTGELVYAQTVDDTVYPVLTVVVAVYSGSPCTTRVVVYPTVEIITVELYTTLTVLESPVVKMTVAAALWTTWVVVVAGAVTIVVLGGTDKHEQALVNEDGEYLDKMVSRLSGMLTVRFATAAVFERVTVTV